MVNQAKLVETKGLNLVLQELPNGWTAAVWKPLAADKYNKSI